MAESHLDTYGWDSVFAISIDVVNAALESVPASARYQHEQKAFGSETARVNWSFFGWRISDVPGGDRIEVTMNLSDGSTLTRIGPSASSETPLEGWSCVVEFQAHFEEGDASTHTLRAVARNGQSWAVVEVVPPNIDPKPSATVALLVQALLSDWFTSSSDAVELFRQEFFKVSLYEDPQYKSLTWLKPKKPPGFAGGVMADGVTKALGILAMTGDRSPATASLTLSPYAIAPNALAGLALSSELVMRNLFLHACAAAFSTEPPGDVQNFQLSGASQSAYQQNRITNVKELHFTHEFDGAQRKASLPAGALEMQLIGDRLQITLDRLHTETSHPGYTCTLKVIESDILALGPLEPPGSGKAFVLGNVSLVKGEVGVEVDTGIRVVEAIVGAVATVGMAALGAVAFRGPATRVLNALGATVNNVTVRVIAGVVAALAAVLGGLAVGIIEWIAHGLASEDHELPAFDPAIEYALKGFSLPSGAAVRFSAEEAQFANGILVTIAPHLDQASGPASR